jgi:peptidoglycan hydrolase CwlO-like protein
MGDFEKMSYDFIRKQKTNSQNLYNRIDYIVFCIDNIDKNVVDVSKKIDILERKINNLESKVDATFNNVSVLGNYITKKI